MDDIQKMSAILGLIAGALSICLWIVLSFFNPYSNPNDIESILNTFIMLCLPACLAIISSLKSKKVFMLIAFICSLPISLYVTMTPSIFALFGVTCLAYLLSYLLVLSKRLLMILSSLIMLDSMFQMIRMIIGENEVII